MQLFYCKQQLLRVLNQQTETAIVEKEKAITKAKAEQDGLAAIVAECEAKVAEAERRLQAVMVGKSEDTSVDKTFAEQLKGMCFTLVHTAILRLTLFRCASAGQCCRN